MRSEPSLHTSREQQSGKNYDHGDTNEDGHYFTGDGSRDNDDGLEESSNYTTGGDEEVSDAYTTNAGKLDGNDSEGQQHEDQRHEDDQDGTHEVLQPTPTNKNGNYSENSDRSATSGYPGVPVGEAVYCQGPVDSDTGEGVIDSEGRCLIGECYYTGFFQVHH